MFFVWVTKITNDFTIVCVLFVTAETPTTVMAFVLEIVVGELNVITLNLDSANVFGHVSIKQHMVSGTQSVCIFLNTQFVMLFIIEKAFRSRCNCLSANATCLSFLSIRTAIWDLFGVASE